MAKGVLGERAKVMNTTEEFIKRVYALQVDDALRHAAKRCLLDYLGCALAGAAAVSDKTGRFLEYHGHAEGAVPVIGARCRASALLAAMVNGMHAHVLEMDDGERYGMLHPGAPVISAVLSVAAAHKLSGEALLNGIITGYEVALRVAAAVQPGAKERGYHGTGICGVIGAAIGAARALGVTQESAMHVLSAAATSSSGLLKVIRDQSELKPYNAGLAASNGVNAVYMGLAGFHGPDDVLSGDEGLLAVLSPNYNSEWLLTARDDRWGIQRIYVKPYAACRHCHAPIEAALRIRATVPGAMDRIDQIRVLTHRWAAYGHDHDDIRGTNSAKMSIPYSVAIALLTGKAGLDEFSLGRSTDPDVLGLAKIVRVEVLDELTQLVPDKRAAIVDIRFKDGRRLIERIDLPKGEPENPVTDEELKEKFQYLLGHADRDIAAAERIHCLVWNVEHDLHPLLAALD